MLTDNLFGDILSDEAAADRRLDRRAAVGLARPGGPALYEPIHGAAPDIAGKGHRQPDRRDPDRRDDARARVPAAADGARGGEGHGDAALREVRTPDIGGDATTDQLTEAVLRHLSWSRWSNDTEEEPVGAEWGV